MSIQETVGRDVMDRLVLKSHFYLGSNVTAPDYAMAILQADRDLYGGTHMATLVYWLGTVKRFIDPALFALEIAHTPLANTPSLSGPFVVKASVRSTFGIRPESVKLVCGWDGRFLDTLTMVPTGVPHEFAVALPSVGKIAVYQYYMFAEDSLSQHIVSPAAAPAAYYAFVAGENATGVDDHPGALPSEYVLQQNYPNPFNPSTVIRFGLPTASGVRLRVFATTGEEIAELMKGELGAGWHSVQWNAAAGFSSGMYLYTLEINSSQGMGARILSGRMLLLK
jgi:hypothetical protein